MSIALWLTILSSCSAVSSMVVDTPPTLTLMPSLNSTGLLSDLPFPVSDDQRAPELAHALSFMTGGKISTNLDSENISWRSNLSTGFGAIYRCNAGLYGRPNARSCQQAFDDIPVNNREVTFGNRTADQTWDVPLPFRFISRESLLAMIEKAKPRLSHKQS